MRILLSAQTYGPTNGPGVFTAALARGLAAAGDEAVVITPSGTLRSTVRADGAVTLVNVRACSLGPIYPEVRLPLVPARIVRALVARIEPDVVHIQDHYPTSRSVARACTRLGMPMVATNHFVPENILPHVPILSRSRRGRLALERLLWRMVARVFEPAAVVVSPTETAAARLRPHLRPVPQRAISCGVDLAFFGESSDRGAVRRAFGLAAEDLLFIYVGRLDVEKKVDVLVRAIAEIPWPRVKLLVVGRGRQAGALRRLVRRLHLGHRVLFAGFVPPDELPPLLRSSDYFAIAGDVELQSIATLEAMAAGLPVLAAAGGALPELVEDGINGALFRPGDEVGAAARMRELIVSSDRWRSMSRASVERARRHSFEQTVAAYRDLYAGVLGGRPAAPTPRGRRR